MNRHSSSQDELVEAPMFWNLNLPKAFYRINRFSHGVSWSHTVVLLENLRSRLLVSRRPPQTTAIHFFGVAKATPCNGVIPSAANAEAPLAGRSRRSRLASVRIAQTVRPLPA